MPEPARIHKLLAEAGVASRRAAEALVAAGRVTVDGVPARIGQLVDPGSSTIAVDGRPLGAPAAHVYLALGKPAGVTSTVRDRHAAATVLDLVPATMRRRAGRLYPVGRLDRDTEGLLLLTNDGGWADSVLHPRFGVEREYAVGLDRRLTPDQARALRSGIQLDEGLARLSGLRAATAPEVRKMAAGLASGPRDLVWYRATLTQGWRRQLRRMFLEVGAPVRRLVRVRIGTLRLEGLRSGEVRELTRREVAALAAMGPRGTESEPCASVSGPEPDAVPGLVVSLDGPASSGKSSVGAAAAAAIGYRFCDTGLLYRALTWLALQRAVELEDAAALIALVPEVVLAADDGGRYTHVRVDERDVTALVHSGAVDRAVSQVAHHPAVRAALRPVQRSIARSGRMIMAGRDIGAVILPDADLKLYLDASLGERVRRRAEERAVPLGSEAYERLAAELRRRDERDQPQMRRAPDAVVITTDGNAFADTVTAVVAAVRERERSVAGAGA